MRATTNNIERKIGVRASAMLLALLVVAACASTGVPPPPQVGPYAFPRDARGVPHWVDDPSRASDVLSADWLLGYGVSDDSHEQAGNRARDAVLLRLHAFVVGAVRACLVDDDDLRAVVSGIHVAALTPRRLPELMLHDAYTDGFTFFALWGLDKTKLIDRAREEAITARERAVATLVGAGVTFEGGPPPNVEFAACLAAITDLRDAVLPVFLESRPVPVGVEPQPPGGFDVDRFTATLTRARELAATLAYDVTGTNVQLAPRQRLPEDIRITVTVGGVPMADFPMRTEVTLGQATLDFAARTDADGVLAGNLRPLAAGRADGRITIEAAPARPRGTPVEAWSWLDLEPATLDVYLPTVATLTVRLDIEETLDDVALDGASEGAPFTEALRAWLAEQGIGSRLASEDPDADGSGDAEDATAGSLVVTLSGRVNAAPTTEALGAERICLAGGTLTVTRFAADGDDAEFLGEIRVHGNGRALAPDDEAVVRVACLDALADAATCNGVVKDLHGLLYRLIR